MRTTRKMTKLLLIIFILSIAYSSPAYPQQQSELTLTTYYPSPYGEYNQLRLTPQAAIPACGSNNNGTLYYNSSTKAVYYCDGSDWQQLGGGGAGLWVENSAENLSPRSTASSLKVGIGKTNPKFKLDVSGKANAINLCIGGACKGSWGYVSCPKDQAIQSFNIQTGQATCASITKEPPPDYEWQLVCTVRDTSAVGWGVIANCPTYGNCGTTKLIVMSHNNQYGVCSNYTFIHSAVAFSGAPPSGKCEAPEQYFIYRPMKGHGLTTCFISCTEQRCCGLYDNVIWDSGSLYQCRKKEE